MFEQYKLPFAYDALEPVLDALTMETHYTDHYVRYTEALNKCIEDAGIQDRDRGY